MEWPALFHPDGIGLPGLSEKIGEYPGVVSRNCPVTDMGLMPDARRFCGQAGLCRH